MDESSPAIAPMTRRQWLLSGWPILLAGGLILAVSNGRWVFPLGAWLAPLLLLRYFREARKPWIAVAALWLTVFVSMPIAWLGLWPFPPAVLLQMVAVSALWAVVPYVLDRLSLHRLPAAPQTLVFPCAAVAIEFITSELTQSTWGNLAYTQTENLPLLQLASVAGIWGISFLMLWLAPVLNTVWQRGTRDRPALLAAGLYAAVAGLVILLGSARLTLFPPSGEAMRVAMLSPPEVANLDSPEGVTFFQDFQKLFSKQPIAPDRALGIRESFRAIVEPVFAAVSRQARAGARLVVLSEASLISFGEEEDEALIARAQQLARENRIYFGLAVAKVPLAADRKNENRLILIDPSGTVVQTYWKHQTVPLVEAPFAVAGSEQVLSHSSDDMTLGGVICYDLDSPAYLRTAGQHAIDVLMAPTGDWPAIKDIHARMALMRAVEQGFSLVRPANHGLSIATDYQGRILGRMDHFSTSERQLVAWVPTRGVTTLYTRLGDWLPWLCVLLSICCAAWLPWQFVKNSPPNYPPVAQQGDGR